jgi:acyl-ACP thioesterase
MSVWALVDLETRRPIRASEFTYNFTGDVALDLELPRRIRFPAEVEEVGCRRVVYSDCDYNGHINNTHYPDLLCDFLPDGENRPVEDVVINFLGEAPLGDTLTVCRAADPERDGRYLFRTRRADGSTNIEAVLTLAEHPQ